LPKKSRPRAITSLIQRNKHCRQCYNPSQYLSLFAIDLIGSLTDLEPTFMTVGIPQIISIIPVSPDGRMNLDKNVRQYLGMKGALFIHIRDEVLLSVGRGKGEKTHVEDGHLILPEEALRKLKIRIGSLIGLVQRGNAVAIKRFEVSEREGERARIVDIETKYKITRMIEVNPMPWKALRQLKRKYKRFKLRYDAMKFLQGRRTFEAWKARRMLGKIERYDEDLRRELVRERLESQSEDGSWEGASTITARNLRELAELGLRRDAKEVRHAVSWLMKRPESPYNPGMFFVTDELVKEQEEVIRSRRKQTKGPRDRFRQKRGPEIRLVKAGDALIGKPCGPRIMWPNALVLEALLKQDFEMNERVRRALWSLLLHDWCECAYQHGLSGFGRKVPYSREEITRIEEECMLQYRYGGMSNTKEEAHKANAIPRIGRNNKAGAEEYTLRMPEHLQGCELITTRAMSQVRDERIKRYAEAHLWRFAGRQHSADGRYIGKYPEGYFSNSQAGYLSLFASYDHPVSKVAIMRSIPWIVDNQNRDGSWGDEPNKDSSTLAVISALKNVGLI